MAKENVKKMMGVMAGVFAHTGHLSKDEAREMSGLSEDEFHPLYEKASKVVKKLEGYDKLEDRYNKFSDHLMEEIDEFIKKFGPFNMGL